MSSRSAPQSSPPPLLFRERFVPQVYAGRKSVLLFDPSQRERLGYAEVLDVQVPKPVPQAGAPESCK